LQQLQRDEEDLHSHLYAEATLAARASVRKQVVEFNTRLVEGTEFEGSIDIPPVFFDCVDSQGVQVSAARGPEPRVCMFFTERAHLRQPTLLAVQSHINAIYAARCEGPPPWDVSCMSPEQPKTRRFIKKLIASADKPTPHPPLDHDTLCRVVTYLKRPSKGSIKSKQPPIASFAMAACIAIMRGTGCRPQEVAMLQKRFIKDNVDNRGRLNGLDIFFPKVNEKGKKVKLKGKSGALVRWKVMPEFLDDGLHVAGILRDFLDIAPDRGPVFRKVSGRKHAP
jgi:hypothetical protein